MERTMTDRRRKALVKVIVTNLMDRLDCGDGMAEVEIAQDANYEAVEVTADILKSLGYTDGQVAYDELMDAAVTEVRFVPSHWEFTNKRRKR